VQNQEVLVASSGNATEIKVGYISYSVGQLVYSSTSKG